VTLSVAAVLLANGGKTTSLAVLVDRVDDPVDAGIATDSLVGGIDKDDLEVLVGSILVNPVGVQDTQISALAANTLLSGGLERALVLELVDTLVDGLTEGSTLGGGSLTVTAANTDTVDDITLLGLVAETTSLVRAGGAGSTVNDIQLSDRKAESQYGESYNIHIEARLFFLYLYSQHLTRSKKRKTSDCFFL
jgi:hypothetical protein